MGRMLEIQTKRVYEAVEKEDGSRVLVDRVWPRGIAKERLQARQWLKEAAPSTALRKWFGHDRTRWEEFKNRYFAELDAQPEVIQELLGLAAQDRLTLLYAARDTRCNQAVALKDYLVARSGKDAAPATPSTDEK